MKRSEQLNMLELFPDIDKVINIENTDRYTYLAISVFDHWLSEKEANEYLSKVSEYEQELRNSKFRVFSKKIMENTSVVNFTLKGRGSRQRVLFRKFTSESGREEYMNGTLGALSSRRFFKVALPDIEALYFQGWDDTNIFYFLGERGVKEVKSWAAESGLYSLSRC